MESRNKPQTKRAPPKKDHQPQITYEDHDIKEQPPDQINLTPTATSTMEIEGKTDILQEPEWAQTKQNRNATQVIDMNQEQVDLQPPHKIN